MNKIVLTALLLISLKANAQEIKLFGESVNSKVQLKWMSKKVFSNTSYDIYRSEGSGNWEKINNSPITPSPLINETELKSKKNIFPDDKSYEFYIKNKNTIEKDVNKQAYTDYQLIIGAIFDNQIAKHLGIFFQDENVSNGKNYNYKLVDSKTQKEVSLLNNIKVGEISSAPEKVEFKQESQNLNISWKNNENFFGYNIYRNGTKINEEPIMANFENNAYNVYFIDQNLSSGSYKYTIKGITFLNTESKPSNELTFTIKDLTPPSIVKGLKTERKDNTVTLSWIQAIDKDIIGYNILRSDDNGKTFKKINEQPLNSKENSFTDKFGEATSGTFYYKIESVDSNNNGKSSNPISILVPDHFAPSKPLELISRVQPGKVTLSWKSNTEKDLAGYRIYRGLKDDDENEMLLLNVTPQKENVFTDNFYEKAGTKFIYKIAAIDNSFNESEKAILWVQLPDVIPPQAPFLKEATLENNKITLKWDKVLTDNILGYDVYRKFNDDAETKLNENPIIDNNFIDTKIDRKGIYQFYIKALDSAKLVSKPSNKVSVSTGENNNISIRLLITQDARSKKIQIKTEGINPKDIQEAKLFRRTGNSGFLRISYNANETLFTDESTEQGKIYEYYLEIITVDQQVIKSNKVTFNNS